MLQNHGSRDHFDIINSKMTILTTLLTGLMTGCLKNLQYLKYCISKKSWFFILVGIRYYAWSVDFLSVLERPNNLNKILVTSMLVTDVGDQMCWRHDLNVADKLRCKHRELGTNIKYQSPTSHFGVLWCWWPM